MQLSSGNDFQPNQLLSKQLMALLNCHCAGCMSLLARPCLPRYVHRMPAAFAPLHRCTEKRACNSDRRCHSRASVTAETEIDSKQSVTVRPAMLSELDDVAWLRAEAFYEVTLHIHCARVLGQRSNERDVESGLTSRLRHGTGHSAFVQDQPHLRYVGSFKRQFKEQEARSLRDRIRQRQGQVGPDCVCLVAIEEADGEGPEVLGTLDVEPPGSALARDREAPAVSALPIASEYGRERAGDIPGHLAWIRRRLLGWTPKGKLCSAGVHICAQCGGVQQA